jgi:hypothetical protein
LIVYLHNLHNLVISPLGFQLEFIQDLTLQP